MLIFGDPIIDWSAIWKIVVVALIGGCGVVVVYGFLLLGVKYTDHRRLQQNPHARAQERSATPSPPSARSSSSA